MLDSNFVSVSGQKAIVSWGEHPTPGHAASWGGAEPRLCSIKHKSFCWDLDYSKFDILPAFRSLLQLIDVDPGHALRFRFGGYRHFACVNKSCGVHDLYLPIIYSGLYHPHRSFKHVSRCVSRVMDQVEFLEKSSPVDYLSCLDLTCPGEISKRATDPDVIRRLRRAVNIFIDKLRVLLFHDKRSRLGGFYSIHVWKTTKPLDPHLHVHLQLFNVAYNARERRFYRFKPMISHLYVKQAWRDALKSQGLWDDPLDQHLPDCHVRYIKLKNRGRLIHRLRYVFRKPTVDLNSNLKPEDLHDLDPIWIRYLLAFIPRRVKVGFMNNLKRLGFLWRKSFFERCPVCGGTLLKLERVPGNLPDLPHFIRDRGGSWIPTDPPPCSTGGAALRAT